jgi:hypothetical protein
MAVYGQGRTRQGKCNPKERKGKAMQFNSRQGKGKIMHSKKRQCKNSKRSQGNKKKGMGRASRQARQGHAEAEECRENTRQGHSGQGKRHEIEQCRSG